MTANAEWGGKIAANPSRTVPSKTTNDGGIASNLPVCRTADLLDSLICDVRGLGTDDLGGLSSQRSSITNSTSRKLPRGGGGNARLWLCLCLIAATPLLSACGRFVSPPPTVKETGLPPGIVAPTDEPPVPDDTPLPTSEAESPTTIPFADTFTPAGWSADGQLLGLTQRRAQVLVDASGNEQAQVWYPGAEAVGGTPTFSPDGQLLVSLPYSNLNGIELWHPASDGAIRQLSVPGGPINELSFSPDSRLLAIGADDGAVSLLDLSGCATDSGECGVHLRTIQAHAPGATRAVFSPDASLLASEGADLSLIHI